jgi:hypothetical protein
MGFDVADRLMLEGMRRQARTAEHGRLRPWAWCAGSSSNVAGEAIARLPLDEFVAMYERSRS